MATTSEKTYTVNAGPEDAGARLDRLLAAALDELSRSRVKALILDGRVAAGGATIADASYRVKPGERFAVTIPAPAPAIPEGQDIALDVVYEDDAIIVVDKPAGLVVHPAPGNPDRTLVNALIAHCGDSLSGVGGVMRPGIVHRLDKDTSGLMVAAKSDAAHRALAGQFASRTAGRRYRAVVWGVPVPVAGTISGNIGRGPRNRKKMAVLRRGGRSAVTHFRTLEALAGVATLVECRLETGRTHQIRVHLAAKGHPVVGDALYGGRRRAGGLDAAARRAIESFHRQALHAFRLEFDHPLSHERLGFDTDLPRDLKRLIEVFRSASRP